MKIGELTITKLWIETDEKLEAHIQQLSNNMAKAQTYLIYLANEYLRDVLLEELTRRDELRKIIK